MNWIERSGKYLALTAFALMWPVFAAYQQWSLSGVRAVAYTAAAGLYALVYVWYCLAGYRDRSVRAAASSVGSLTALAVVLHHLSGADPSTYYHYFLIPFLIAGFGLRTRLAIVAVAIVASISAVDWILLERSLSAPVLIQATLAAPIAVLFGGAAFGLRYLLWTVRELRTARAEIAQHAADRERARIARDLHDLLGRNLSLITLKGELATRLLPEAMPGSDEVRDMLGLSREALQQVREVVSGYRQPTLANELAAARLALEAAAIEVDIRQSVGALDRESEAVAGWVIREATTNVIRHSGAKHCQITLTRDDGRMLIEITNDGWRVPAAPAGNGLRGLEERLAAMGGTLDASAQAGTGFRLFAAIPAIKHSDAHATDVEVIA